MKLSISNIAWSNENDEEMYKYISSSGFNALEIAPTRIFPESPYDRLDEAKTFANELKNKYNLEISSMQSIWYGKSEKIFGSSEERNELIKYTKKAIDFAHEIGCNNLVFGCPKNRIISEKDNIEIAIEFFKEIGKYAEIKNTVFSIEPNPTIYNTNFINATKDAFEIAKKVNCKGIKVNVDLGTIIENEEDINILDNNIDLINHIHISEPYLEIVKQRDIHLKLLEILQKSGYNRYVSIEMKKLENIDDVKKVMNYIKGVFKK